MNKGPDTKFSREWKIVVARDFEEIEAIRPIWEQMRRNEPHATPDTDIDKYLSIIRARGDDIQPHVMLIEHNDQPSAMTIGRIWKRQLKLKLGYKVLFRPSLRCLSIVYGGILGQPEGELCSLLVGELMKQLRSREVDMVYFNHLRTGTAFYQAVSKTPGFLTQGHFPEIDEHWCMSVPEKMEQFYLARSRGHRHNLRRTVSKFEEEYPGENQFINYTTKSEVDDFIRISTDISSKTYQRALGSGIVDDEQTKCLMTAAARHGWFRGHILFAGDKPCAFQLGVHYKKVYYMDSVGYDPALSSYKPGTILFLKVLESLCNDSSIDKIDFYFGDAEYKRRYGTERWPEACISIFAPRAYPVLVNILQSFMLRLSLGIKFVLSRTDSIDWVKRRWRNFLQIKNLGSKRWFGI